MSAEPPCGQSSKRGGHTGKVCKTYSNVLQRKKMLCLEWVEKNTKVFWSHDWIEETGVPHSALPFLHRSQVGDENDSAGKTEGGRQEPRSSGIWGWYGSDGRVHRGGLQVVACRGWSSGGRRHALGQPYTIRHAWQARLNRHACHACLIVYGRKNLPVRKPDTWWKFD